MDMFYLICALFGGTVLLLQFGLTLLGIGGDLADSGGEAPGVDGSLGDGGASIFKMVSFQTIVAALAFFGIGGKAARASGLEQLPALLIALGAGVAAMYAVYYVGSLLHRFNSDGTVRIQRAVGQTGTVYIPVPGENSGTGKIQMTVQNRIMEFAAVTDGERLPAGAKIRVVDVISLETLRVEKLVASETPHHV